MAQLKPALSYDEQIDRLNHLSMDCFLAHVVEGSLVLKEHEAARWLKKNELDSVKWLPADQTIIEWLKQRVFEGNDHDG